nr:DNA polymerase [Calliteara abietis nucleopolyhedrovirus]
MSAPRALLTNRLSSLPPSTGASTPAPAIESGSSEMQTDAVSSSLFNLKPTKWETLQNELAGRRVQTHAVNINTKDVFRITKMAYKDEYLLIFLTGYLDQKPNEVYQFYVEAKCDLYSYQLCYSNHIFATCRNNCKSYKTFVMPGVRHATMQTLNVFKYKCNNSVSSTIDGGGEGKNKRKPLDYFLRHVNRVHMQTDLKEGQYVSFVKPQLCVDHKLKCDGRDLDTFKNIFNVIPIENLTRKIAPVVMCYDIETHSNGLTFSNARNDHIMSISVVVRQNANTQDSKFCFYYLPNDAADDLNCDNNRLLNGNGNGNDNDNNRGSSKENVIVVRFNREADMLKAFFDLLPLLNPDYVLDYNGNKFDLPFILERMEVLLTSTSPNNERNLIKRARYSALARCTTIRRYDLQPSEIDKQQLHDKFMNKIDNYLFSYYVHVDLYQFLSTDSEYNNLENYQLNTVAEHYLKRTKVDLSIAEMLRLYNSNCVRKIIEYNVQDSVLPIDLFTKLEIVEFLYTQCMLLFLCTDDLLSNISHKISVVFFNLCLTNTSIDSNGETVPDPFIFNKNDLAVTSGRKRVFAAPPETGETKRSKPNNDVDLTLLNRQPISPADMPPANECVKLCTLRPVCNYKGGKVFEPQSGLKRWVVTLDFNSLYPTIMMYEGVCFSNLFVGSDKHVYLHKNMDAIIPKVLRSLTDLRNHYKRLRDQQLKNSFLYQLYDQLQNAVKRISNSIYGYLGIYFKVLANYVTKLGRRKLSEVTERVESMTDDDELKQKYNLTRLSFKIIYGDTDSIFIQVLFDENEIPVAQRYVVIENIVRDVLTRVNTVWHGKGYKMALENVMSSLILLKKKKYCYINSEDAIKYKGWLVKKDMPLILRKTFREVVDLYLKGHSLACGLHLLFERMRQSYHDFDRIGDGNKLMDYSFSMSYNETSTTAAKSKRASDSAAAVRKPIITIAKHCRELLLQSGVKDLPGNGDRIPFLLIDVKGNITQKSYPLALFNSKNLITRVSWLKYINILCNFLNELLVVFADDNDNNNLTVFKYYFEKICSLYMARQMYDVKYPVMTVVKPVGAAKKPNIIHINNGDDDVGDHENDTCYDDDDDDDSDTDNDKEDCNSNSIITNTIHAFKMYARKPKLTFASGTLKYVKHNCSVCDKAC